MDVNAAKCFICDVECVTEEKYLGTNIARTLTMPMTAVLAKCLRTIVDTENEYFCSECTRKIEEYDQMVQLSLQIETELYELYKKKPIESCYLLEAEIIDDQNAISEEAVDHLKLENETIQTDILDAAPESELNETYDEMVVEYLEEYEAPESDDDELISDENKITVSEMKLEAEPKSPEGEKVEQEEEQDIGENGENGANEENEENEESKVEEVKTVRKTRGKKKGTRGRATRKKPVELEEEETVDLNCQECSFTAKTRIELEAHKTIEHLDEMKRLKCDICGRIYKSKSALCVHLASHNGGKSHECHICGKTFTQRGALVRHMPMHTGEQPHQCEVCGKRFIHYSSFHMHQMIHTNVRTKTCNICGSGFRSNSHMTRHMRTHSGERPFACSICGQRFAQRYNMKTHYNTHQGIHRPQTKNYRCLICMEAFPRREKLNKHLRQMHHINDEDITALAENGPDSEIGIKIIQRLKSSVYSNEDILIEYIDESNEIITPDECK